MSESNKQIPDEFYKIIKDFTTDILTTFPEYKNDLDAGLLTIVTGVNNISEVEQLFEYIKQVYPERFFDLLYQNEDMFTNENINTNFLPNIDFSDLWKQDISDNTKTVIWKYLQLVLFAVVGSENDIKSFGNTAKLFEAINEEELKTKLEETMSQMASIFDMSGVADSFGVNNSFDGDVSGMDHLPNADDLHEHINEMLQGNLGKLAAEISEETMNELDLDMSNAESAGDIFQQLFKNPGKLMNMIKKVGTKLDSKLQSGELKESELMKEAMDLMKKMDTMPGMKNMKSMLGQMGMPMSQNTKLNKAAMSGKLKQNLKSAQQKERMQKKLEQRRVVAQKDNQIQILQQQLAAAREANQAADQAADQAVGQATNQKISNIKTTKSKRKKKRKNRKNKK